MASKAVASGPPPKKVITLSEEDIDKARAEFDEHDSDGRGFIESWRLREMLERLGFKITEEESFELISETCRNEDSNMIDFAEYLLLIKVLREKLANADNDTELIDAFVVLGGNPDRTGQVLIDRLADIVKKFGLNIDERLLYEEIDADGSGQVDFSEFCLLLRGGETKKE